MADDQPPPLTGAAALRAQSKVPLQTAPPPAEADTTAAAPPAPSGAAALRAQSKVPLAGTGGQSPPVPATAPVDDSAWSQTKNLAYQAGQGVLEGGAGMLGLPALAGQGINKLLGKIGVKEDPNLWTGKGWEPSDWLKTAQSVGYDPTQQPKGLGQELVRGLGADVPPAILGALTGMGIPQAAAYTVGPGLAGDLFHHYAPDWSPLWASLPTALTMSGVERVATQSAARAAAAKAAEQAAAQEAAATAARQAHEAQSADASLVQKAQTRGTKNVASAFKQGSEADIAKWHDSETAAADTQLQTEHVGADADREAAAAQLGTSKTLVQGAGVMQDKSRQWLEKEFKPNLAKAEDGMFYKDPLDHSKGTLVPPDAEGDATHLKDSIKHSYVTGAGTEGEPIAAMFRSRLPEQVNAKLDAMAAAQGKPPGTAPTFTFADLRNIRSAIGDALGDPSVISSIGVKKLNEMYRGVNEDIRAAVSKSAGQEGLDAFDKFNKEATRLFGVAGTVGDNIVTTTNVGKETITPYQVANKDSLWNDSTKVNQLRSEKTLNEGVNEVAASKLRAGGRDAETAYDKLPEGKAAMFGNQAPALDAVVARRVAAEKAAADAKTGLDTQRDQLLKDATQAKEDIRQHGAALRDVQTAERSKTGTGLRQTEENARANRQQLTDWAKELQRKATSVGGREFPFWFRNAPSLASGFMGGQHLLHEFGPTLPDWGTNLVGATGAGASYLGWKGLQELYDNPASARNLLLGGAASSPPSPPPNKLGYSVTPNK